LPWNEVVVKNEVVTQMVLENATSMENNIRLWLFKQRRQ
jgi:hypothetical protein